MIGIALNIRYPQLRVGRMKGRRGFLFYTPDARPFPNLPKNDDLYEIPAHEVDTVFGMIDCGKEPAEIVCYLKGLQHD